MIRAKGKAERSKEAERITEKVQHLVEDLNQSRIIAYQANYASNVAEKEYMVAEQSSDILEEASKLDEQVQQGNIKLESLEHQIKKFKNRLRN